MHRSGQHGGCKGFIYPATDFFFFSINFNKSIWFKTKCFTIQFSRHLTNTEYINT